MRATYDTDKALKSTRGAAIDWPEYRLCLGDNSPHFLRFTSLLNVYGNAEADNNFYRNLYLKNIKRGYANDSDSVDTCIYYPFLFTNDEKMHRLSDELDECGIEIYEDPTIIDVDRENLFESFKDQFLYIMDYFKNKTGAYDDLYVQFKNELGQDDGGPTLECFQLLIPIVFGKEKNLFLENEYGELMPNPTVESTESNKKLYELAGGIVGLLVYRGSTIPIRFTATFLKDFLEIPLYFEDLQSMDNVLYIQLKSIASNNTYNEKKISISYGDMTFQILNANKQPKNLIENGANIELTYQNREVICVFNKNYKI